MAVIGRKNINEWISLIQKRDSLLMTRLESIYGQDRGLIDERLNVFLKVAVEFRRCFGREREVSFVRVPGRLNTLGMHIDHRGGFVNPIAIPREIVLCYSGRGDDMICVYNLDVSYGLRRFNIRDELPSDRIDTVKAWLAWTQKETDIRKEKGINQDWASKLEAIPVYLQVIYPDKRLSGFDGVLDSNIPARMGLSSSSAIIVAMMEIMIEVNHISMTDDEFVNRCGMAEWFVGTRGGSGDHAAIKFSRLGKITHMKTLPRLMIKSYLPFPQGYVIVIFNSGITADKTGPARQKFNEKVAAYEIGEIYLREYSKSHFPDEFQKIIESRGDLPPEEKKFYLADAVEYFSKNRIYELLEYLPERINREKLLEQFPERRKFLQEQFATHLEPEDGYELRAVITYGLSEAERSRMLEGIINESRIDLFGGLMNISHDGDRVVFQPSERKDLKKTIDTEKELYEQPGGYGCSLPEIDAMVDTARGAGALGAQISGAGLGGSIMALVAEDKFAGLVETMRMGYYKPRRIEEDFLVAAPIEGAGQL